MIECKKCGTSNEDGSLYCRKCGAQLKKKSKKLFWIITLSIIVISTIVALIVAISSKRDSYYTTEEWPTTESDNTNYNEEDNNVVQDATENGTTEDEIIAVEDDDYAYEYEDEEPDDYPSEIYHDEDPESCNLVGKDKYGDMIKMDLFYYDDGTDCEGTVFYQNEYINVMGTFKPGEGLNLYDYSHNEWKFVADATGEFEFHGTIIYHDETSCDFQIWGE